MANNETNNKRPARKKNFHRDDSMKNYIKLFDNFGEGYNEMISILPTLKIYGGDVANYDMVVKKMMEIIGDNIPSPDNPNFPNTLAFSIKQNEVGFRTDDRIAFGWKIFFNRDTGKYIYQMRVTFFAVSMSTRKFADALTENGWNIVDFSKEDRFQRSSNNGNSKRSNKAEKKQQKEVNNKQQNDQKDTATNQETQEILDKVSEPVVNTPVPEPALVEEQIAEEIIQNQTKKQPEPKKYWINRGAVAGVFIITYEGRTFVVNINDAAQPAGVVVDKNSSTIRIGLVAYNYETMNYVIDEGSSQFVEKETEDEDTYIIPQNGAQTATNATQVVSPSGAPTMAQTVVRMADA